MTTKVEEKDKLAKTIAEPMKPKQGLWPETKKKKVAICGTAPSVTEAPFNDNEFDIWGVAHCLFLQPVTRLDAIFELHKKDIWVKDNAPYQRFPNATIIFQEKDEKYPNSMRYPVNEMLAKYVVNEGYQGQSPYASSSLPFMVWAALEMGYEEIHFYGIHLQMTEEYFYQRPCLEYWIGVAKGMGKKVYMSPAADLLKFAYIYGYQEQEGQVKQLMARKTEFEGRITTLTNQKNQTLFNIDTQINQLIGAREDLTWQLRNFGYETQKAPEWKL